MDLVKIGIMGCGDAATFHSLAFKQRPNPKVKYIAAFDKDEKNLKRVAKRLNMQEFTNLDAFLKSDIDAVLIALPHFLHAEFTKLAAEAGKHVLCEKPMAPSLEECDEMIAVTKKAGVKFMIAENHRFLPAHQKIKEMLTQGYLGDIYLGRTYEGAFVQPQHFLKEGGWQFTYDRAGGGVLADQGVHKFGLLNWLLGEVESGEAFLSKTMKSPDSKGEDNALMTLRYTNGAIIEVMVSSTAVHPLNNNLELHGTKGHLLEDHSWEKPIKVFTNHPNAVKKGEYYEIEADHGAYPKYYTISAYYEDLHFAECIIDNKEPEFTPIQAKEAVATVLLGYLSARKGCRVKMSELKDLAHTKGTKHLMIGLNDFVMKNNENIHW